MIYTISMKYALRSLWRHPRRTWLSIIGIGIGCGIALFAASWIGGAVEMEVRSVAESGAGHLRVTPKGWLDTREKKLRLASLEESLALVAGLPEVKAYAPRARCTGMLAFGNRSAGIEMLGVNPAAEMASNRIVYKGALEGRYLEAGDDFAVVIGKTLAKRLDVEVDDDLYVTLAGKEDIKSAMLRIVGILTTGSRDLDSMICHLPLETLGKLTGYPGAAEIAILLHDYRKMQPVQGRLRVALAGKNEVISWREVNPGLAAGIEGDQAFSRVLMFVIVFVVSLGIASAQLTAVLERRREFAILSALGMKQRQVVALIMLETIWIGLGGAVAALLTGGVASYALATIGIDLTLLVGNELNIGDVLLEPHVYGSFGPWVVSYAFAISLLSTLTASVYPAWTATKSDPADALRMI